MIYRDDHVDRAEQAARHAGAGRAWHHSPPRRACWMRCASARRTGRAWCTGWIATPPACCCWRAPRAPRRNWPPLSALARWRRPTGPSPPAGRSRSRAASTCRSVASAARAANAPRWPSANDPDAARAITDYRTLDHAGQKLAWLELKPLTGRTHQLRVHCVAIGAPILGDVKYARPDQNNAFAATIDGLSSELHLHARALRLPHPAGGTLLVEADLPPHMTETFRTLGFHAPPARPPERR